MGSSVRKSKRQPIRLSHHARLLAIGPLLPSDWPQDPFFLSRQIEAAINFAHSNDPLQPATAQQFGESLQVLLQRLFKKHPQIGFFPWDAASAGSWQPLFARAELMKGIQRLRSFQRAILLVENLRQAIAPAGCYWTARRNFELQQAQNLIEDLIARHAPADASWRLLIA
jgi:hypothetical protein